MGRGTLTTVCTAQEAQESRGLPGWWGSQARREPEGKRDCGEKWGSWDRLDGQGSRV